ncbi:protein of unknown function [Methylocella tundrae]|uniref:Uncharacterized protein n=1 Tax=Methylocella tundrae TaxID=227605 RepID=A0A4U8YZD7_METTU|nr:protein of unknown function [Methylocella tundrae]
MRARQNRFRHVSQSIADVFDRLQLFLLHFVYNTNEEIDAAHRATFIVENQLRVILTVYLTVNVDLSALHSSKIQILTTSVDHLME